MAVDSFYFLVNRQSKLKMTSNNEMPGGININDSPTKGTSSKKTKKTKPSCYYEPAEPADLMSTQAIGERYVLLENIKTQSQKNRAKGALQNTTVPTIARSEVEDRSVEQVVYSILPYRYSNHT